MESLTVKHQAESILLCGCLLLTTVVALGQDKVYIPRTLEGLWSGEDTNLTGKGLSPTPLYAFKLSPTGHGVAYMGSQIGLISTFTYSVLSDGELVCTLNDSPHFNGTLHYDVSADTMIYQEAEAVATALGRKAGALTLQRDTTARLNAMLEAVIGATNYQEVLEREGHFFAPVLREHERIREAYRQEQTRAQGAAPEPPPAAPVQDTSETKNPKPESEAPADGGGR